ncbi:MAG: hypothetical protein AAFZ06_16135 [Pseudomonadota bacterium]
MSLHKAVHLSDAKPRENEFYPTPWEVTRGLLQVEGYRIGQFEKVWEPACGDGAMSRELSAAGFDIVSTDLVDRGYADRLLDFYQAPRLAPAIVTNPPFSQCSQEGKMRWITHAAELGIEYMALLLPAGWSYAQERRKVLRRWPLARVWQVGWRIDFTEGGQPPSNHAWHIWDRAAPATDSWSTGVIYRDELTVYPDLFSEAS